MLRTGRWLSFLVLSLALLTGCAKPPEMEVKTPRQSGIRQSFTEQAETRMVHTYPVNLPVAGRIGRIDLEPGDPVRSGQVLVSYDRFELDSRLAQAQAQVQESRTGLDVLAYTGLEAAERSEARAELSQAEARWQAAKAQEELYRRRHDQSEVDLARSRKLFAEGAIPRQQLEDAQLKAQETRLAWLGAGRDREAARALIEAARTRQALVDSKLERKQLELDQAQARLAQTQEQRARALHDSRQARVTSPITGVVLQRLEQGPRDLPAGAPLLILGRRGDLEVMAEVLTEDALRLHPGSPVELIPGGNRADLKATVTRIEPAGYTKVSSLGVEQKRVKVIARLAEVPDWLGAGYRLQARFITGSKDQALVVDRFSVLQDPRGQSYVFKVEKGKLRRQNVRLGLKGELEYEVTEGLSPSDQIVAVPDPSTVEGTEVTPVAR